MDDPILKTSAVREFGHEVTHEMGEAVLYTIRIALWSIIVLSVLASFAIPLLAILAGIFTSHNPFLITGSVICLVLYSGLVSGIGKYVTTERRNQLSDAFQRRTPWFYQLLTGEKPIQQNLLPPPEKIVRMDFRV